jgi:hypothetical protein
MYAAHTSAAQPSYAAGMKTHANIAARSWALVQAIAAETPELPMAPTIRNRLAAAQLGTSLEHHHAIALLLNAERRTSAFALLRPLWESYIRGTWLMHCVPDEQIEGYWSKPLPSAAKVIEDLKTLPDFEGKVLAEHKDTYWDAMCDFTHSGATQMQQWQSEEFIEPRHTVEDTARVAYIAGLYALLSAVTLVGIAGEHERATRLLKVFDSHTL